MWVDVVNNEIDMGRSIDLLFELKFYLGIVLFFIKNE